MGLTVGSGFDPGTILNVGVDGLWLELGHKWARGVKGLWIGFGCWFI